MRNKNRTQCIEALVLCVSVSVPSMNVLRLKCHWKEYRKQTNNINRIDYVSHVRQFLLFSFLCKVTFCAPSHTHTHTHTHTHICSKLKQDTCYFFHGSVLIRTCSFCLPNQSLLCWMRFLLSCTAFVCVHGCVSSSQTSSKQAYTHVCMHSCTRTYANAYKHTKFIITWFPALNTQQTIRIKIEITNKANREFLPIERTLHAIQPK